MITWVTVWVLTIHGTFNYQLTYSSEEECKSYIKSHIKATSFSTYARCDKQKTPVVNLPSK